MKYEAQLICLAAAGATIACTSTPSVQGGGTTPTAMRSVTLFADGARELDGARRGWAIRYLTFPDSFSRGDVRVVLDGLEALALRDPDGRVRSAAVIWLSTPGHRLNPAGGWSASVVQRLARIAQQSEDKVVRASAIAGLGVQQDVTAAAAELSRLAREADRSGALYPTSYHAVEALLSLGAEGRTTLERLYAANAIPDEATRAHLQKLRDRAYTRF